MQKFSATVLNSYTPLYIYAGMIYVTKIGTDMHYMGKVRQVVKRNYGMSFFVSVMERA